VDFEVLAHLIVRKAFEHAAPSMVTYAWQEVPLNHFLTQVSDQDVFREALLGPLRKVTGDFVSVIPDLPSLPEISVGSSGQVVVKKVVKYLKKLDALLRKRGLEGGLDQFLDFPNFSDLRREDSGILLAALDMAMDESDSGFVPRKSEATKGDQIYELEFLSATGSAASAPMGILQRSTAVEVFYATDRLQASQSTGSVQYNKERSLKGTLHYGKCEVSIPASHKVGKLETPSILRLEFRPDPNEHIVLTKTNSLEEEEFFVQVRASVSRSTTKDAFVFIHGYNVSFEDAARRTGQMAYDLDFVGAPVFYSWPSNGKVADYPKDETNITWSTPHFQRFLKLMSERSGAGRIHIIAHSMGNRAVCDALKALSYDTSAQLKFNHLVLAAPDIDAETFQELAATLQRLTGRITLYQSSKDKALSASKGIHGNPRAGEPLLVIPGLDTIDASQIDTDFLGHSYFSSNWPLLSDIHAILFDDKPPAGRFGLMPMEHKDGRYYAFRK
jgi:esterase/lipase superfamily enzyme